MQSGRRRRRHAPLFITLGPRRRDGTYTALGRRCHQPVLAAVVAQLGAAAELPAELAAPGAAGIGPREKVRGTHAEIMAQAEDRARRREMP